MARTAQHPRRFSQHSSSHLRRKASSLSSSPTPTFDGFALSYHLAWEGEKAWPVVICSEDMIPFKDIGQQPSPEHVAVLTMEQLEIKWKQQSELMDFDPAIKDQLTDDPENKDLKMAYEAVLGSPDRPEDPVWPELDHWRSAYLAKTLDKAGSDTEEGFSPTERPADKAFVDLDDNIEDDDLDDDELFVLSGDPKLDNTSSQPVNNSSARRRTSTLHIQAPNTPSPRKTSPCKTSLHQPDPDAVNPHTPDTRTLSPPKMSASDLNPDGATPHTPPTKSSVAKRKWDVFKTENCFGEEYSAKKRAGADDTPSKGGRKAKWIPDDPPPVPLPPPSALYSNDEEDDDDDDDECEGQEWDGGEIPGLDLETAVACEEDQEGCKGENDEMEELKQMVHHGRGGKAGEVISLPSSSDEGQSSLTLTSQSSRGVHDNDTTAINGDDDSDDDSDQRNDSGSPTPSYRAIANARRAAQQQAPRSSNSALTGAHITGFDGKFVREISQVLHTGDYAPKLLASGHGLEGIATRAARAAQLLHQASLYDAARKHAYWDIAALAGAKVRALRPWTPPEVVVLATLAFRVRPATPQLADTEMRDAVVEAVALEYEGLRASGETWVTSARVLREHEDLAERVYELKAKMLRERREEREKMVMGKNEE